MGNQPVLQPLPTGTITFLLTDIEASTRLWDEAPEAMRRAMVRHDQLVEGIVAQNGGVTVRPRGEGDSRFAVFTRASDAVTAAADLQRALAAESWPTPFPVRARMGLHTGDADVRDGDYYGTAVNLCSRLRNAAHGGQTIISHSTYEHVKDKLSDGLTVLDLGEHRLKGLSRRERLYQLVVPGLPSSFPPLRSLESFHTNLPSLLTSFVGRQREMDQVKGLFGSPARLVTIVGPGGAGKTRLAVEVGTELLTTYEDGVWLIELAPLVESRLVVQTVANVLGIREEPGRPVLRTLLDYVRDKRLLILLDNCEHMIQAAAEFADGLLRDSSRLNILATSREPLHLAGEKVWPIPSLSLPRSSERADPERLSQYEAVKLFLDRALAVQPDFEFTAHNAGAIAQICRRLDGIPLAIELAAARVRVLSAEEIANRLDDRFRLLVGGSRTALPRQRALRALIDWSNDLLSERERLVFRRLSVFVGSFTMEAAESVCAEMEPDRPLVGEPRDDHARAPAAAAAAAIDRFEVLDLLAALVDKSLLMVETASGGRYRMLETIREYAFEQLEHSGEAEEFAERHARFYLQLAKRSYGELWGPRQEYWLPRLEADHDNFRAALEWASSDPNRFETLLFMTATLWRFWEIHGHLSEGRAWLERALALTDDAASLTPRQKWYRAHALRGAGNLVRLQGDYDQAVGLHAGSFTLFREVGDRLGIARELDVLGEIARYQGDYPRALALVNQSLEMRREIGDKEGVAASLGNLGVIAHDQGDDARARELLEESLRLNRETGDKRNIALSLNNLGLIAHAQTEYARASELYEESLALYHELDDKLGISFTLQNLGNVACEQGSLNRAAELYGQCLALKKELGDKRGIARALSGLGEVAFYRGDYASADELVRQSLDLFAQLEVKRGVLLAQNLLAFVSFYRGQNREAAELAEKSLALAAALGTRRGSASAIEVQGLIAYFHSDFARAEDKFRQALAIFEESGDRRNAAFTLVNVARAAYRRGALGAAERAVAESLAFSEAVGNRWGVAFSLEIKGMLERSAGDYAASAESFKKSLRLALEQANRQGIANCIGGLAGLAARIGKTEQAVRLFAADGRLRQGMGSAMGEGDREEYESYTVTLREKLSDESFQALWAEGCQWSSEEAAKQALEV